jgi:TPR repeat protein
MGIAYQRGHGVRPDYVQAYKWYALAKAQPGFETPAAVSMTLENLMQHMSPAQIARAQSMAAAWEKAHKK